MSTKPDQEMEKWRQHWEKQLQEKGDVYQAVRGAPKLLSSKTEDFLTNKLVSALDLSKDNMVIDAGCGAGDSVLTLAPLCKCVVGIDYSRGLLTLAKSRCESEGAGCSLVQGSITDIPLNDKVADRAISLSVLQFIPEEMWVQTLRELRRVTRNGGVVVLWLKNDFTLWSAYRKILSLVRIPRPFRRQSPVVFAEGTLRSYQKSYRSYRKLIRENLGDIEGEWSFALFSWRQLAKLRINNVVERLELTIRSRWPLLLRPLGIEYYFKVRVRK